MITTVRTGREKLSEFFSSPQTRQTSDRVWGGGGFNLLSNFGSDSKTDKITRSHIFRGVVFALLTKFCWSSKLAKS